MGLTCQGLSFRYGRRRPWVLKDLDWTVPVGVSFLLGPNGAGKSTLLNVIATATTAHSGTMSLAGLTLRPHGATLKDWRRIVGWVPQAVTAVPGMTALEQVAYCGWLKGMSRSDAEQGAEAALERVSLAKKATEKTTTLSGGQLRRLGIASALVHECRLIVMDEPTAGLDPNQRARVHRLISGMEEVDFVISTHQTEDLAMRAANVSVMNHGALRWQGTASEFLARGTGHSSETRAASAYHSLIGEEE